MHTDPLLPSVNGAYTLCSEKYKPKWPEINQTGFEKSQISNIITITTDFITDQYSSPNSDFPCCWLLDSVG